MGIRGRSDAGSAPVGSSNAEALFREATIAAVDPSYFEVLDAPVLAGRGFTTADAVPGTRVAIVDQGFVDQILPALRGHDVLRSW